MRKHLIGLIICAGIAAVPARGDAVRPETPAVRRARISGMMRQAADTARDRNYAGAREAYERVAALPDATPAERVNAWLAIAGTYLAEKRTAEAVTVCERGLALPDVGAADRYRLRVKIAEMEKRAEAADRVIAVMTPVVSDPEMRNADKVAALGMIAHAQLDRFDEQAALDQAQAALSLPGLTPAEQAAALSQLGGLLLRMERFDAVRATAGRITALQGVADAPQQAARLTSGAAAAEGRQDEAVRILTSVALPLEAAEVRLQEGAPEKACAVLSAALAAPGITDAERWPMLVKLMDLAARHSQFGPAREAWLRYAAPLLRQDPARHGNAYLLSALRTAMRRGAYPFAVWAASESLKSPGLTQAQLGNSRLYHVNALAAQGRLDEAVRAAAEAGADTRLADGDRLQFALTHAALTFEGSPDVFRAKAATLLQAARAVPAAERPERVAKAARSALMANREPAARGLHALHETLFVPEPKRRYTVAFRSDAPASIDAFLASPLAADARLQAPLDRAFGGDLALALATDVSTGDRAVGEGDPAANAADTRGFFAGACDAEGIHFFIRSADPRARAVAAGLAEGGSYEGYFAPGARQAYVVFMVRLQTGAITTWQSQYDTPQHRQARNEPGSRFRGDHRIPADGYVTHLFFPWELYFDKLPETGVVWEFDVIRWGAGGGKSWSGCKTIHGRSSLGEIVFAMTPADRTAIKRKLVYRAFAAYAKAKITRGEHAGVLDFWRDAELGDPAFYASEVAPLCARFDALAVKVTLDMTDAEVEAIYDEAVPALMNLKFVIEARRAAYLERRRFESGQEKEKGGQ